MNIPTGNSSTTHNVGAGGSLKAVFPLFKKMDITLSSGYYFLPGKKHESGKVLNVNAIPVKGGIRYSLSKGFYVEPQAGFTRFNYERFGYLKIVFGAFTYAGNIGYVINRHFDFSARYEEALFIGPDFSHFALRLGYTF